MAERLVSEESVCSCHEQVGVERPRFDGELGAGLQQVAYVFWRSTKPSLISLDHNGTLDDFRMCGHPSC